MDELALQGLGCQGSGLAQNRAMQYFEELKQNPDGWKLCAQALTSGTYHNNDHIKFFCLQVVEHYLKNRYTQSTQEDHNNVKSFINACLQMEGSETTQGKNFIRNKIAQIISLACVVDYPHRWQTFFEDLLSTLNLGHLAVDMYLRILLAIDSEVVDREIVHTPQESERNTVIKDTMRDHCVTQLADSWFQIMAQTCLSLDRYLYPVFVISMLASVKDNLSDHSDVISSMGVSMLLVNKGGSTK